MINHPMESMRNAGNYYPWRITLHSNLYRMQDPPRENRILMVKGHADCVNRHTLGHDWWGHPDILCASHSYGKL